MGVEEKLYASDPRYLKQKQQALKVSKNILSDIPEKTHEQTFDYNGEFRNSPSKKH